MQDVKYKSIEEIDDDITTHKQSGKNTTFQEAYSQIENQLYHQSIKDQVVIIQNQPNSNFAYQTTDKDKNQLFQYKLPEIRSIDNISQNNIHQKDENNSIQNNKSILLQQNKGLIMPLGNQSNNSDTQVNNPYKNLVIPENKFVKNTGNYYFNSNNQSENANTNARSTSLQKYSVQQSTKNNNSQSQQQAFQMTDEEKQLYGFRNPNGYKRLSLLGRGGCALVWLSQDVQNNRQVAIKQFPKNVQGGYNGNLESGFRELTLNKKLFMPNGEPYPTFKGHPGINTICKLLDNREDKSDLYLMFELCGKPMSKSIFDVKGEFYKGERIYQVCHRERIYQIFEVDNCKAFKEMIRQLAQALNLFQIAGLVHSDLKTENILLDFDFSKNSVKSIKIIDFGSSFSFQNINSGIELTTPEYLAPEILDYLENKTQILMQGTSGQTDLSKRQLPWSIDIWSLGAILLEFVIGFPLWLSYKGRIVKDTQIEQEENKNGGSICMTGLFGIQGRVTKKIAIKQREFVKNLKHIMKKQFNPEWCLGQLNKNEEFLDLLSKLLELNPKLRISPKEILEHPFLQIN